MRSMAFGALFLLGLGVLVYYTIFLSAFSFGGRVTLDVRFPDGKWLTSGDKILVAGTRIGRVGRVEYLEEEVDEGFPVRAYLELDRDLKLFEDARVRIVSSTLLGGRMITIAPGQKGQARRVSEIEFLRGDVQGDLAEAVESVVSENREALKRTIDSVAQASADLAKLLRALEEGQGSAGRLLRDEALHREVLGMIEDARGLLQSIRSRESSFGRLLADDTLYEEIEGIAKALREIAEGASRGEGLAGLLLRDSEMRARIDRIVARLDDATAAIETQQGLVGALIYDGGVKSALQELSRNVETISAEIASGRSLAGEILVGRRLVSSIVEPLEVIMADARALVQNTREGRGIAGMLLSDNESAALVRSILRNFARSLEDAREAAPIGTLVGVLIGIC
ncbi:MAG: MCE family protein [Planctomycetes bacterium]|nr:MCE family protein [Planctomycetota bacterium]